MNVVIMAGGTGGHIFPGLAVAKKLQDKSIQVTWLGAIGGMEAELVKQQNIDITLLNIKGLRGKGIKGLLTLPFKLISATWQARKHFKKHHTKAVISMGGYVAGPGGLAAKLSGIPLLVHEQNSKFGMTNKHLSRWAQKVLTGFDLNGLYGSQWVGNPVRAEIEQCTPNQQADRVNVLIVGGSLGANSLNTRLPPLLKPLLSDQRIAVKHQCGKHHRDITCQHYGIDESQQPANLQVMPFIDDMSKAYAWADFIIARAGALTIAEINAVGLASILVPYPYAVDDHQTENANSLVHNKAAFLWQEDQDIGLLQQHLQQLVEDEILRQNMANQSKQLHKKDAAESVANACLEMIS